MTKYEIVRFDNDENIGPYEAESAEAFAKQWWPSAGSNEETFYVQNARNEGVDLAWRVKVSRDENGHFQYRLTKL